MIFMTAEFRDWSGRFVDPCRAEKQRAAFDWSFNQGSVNKWEFMRDCLARWCLQRAADESTNQASADRWMDRYRAIRGIL